MDSEPTNDQAPMNSPETTGEVQQNPAESNFNQQPIISPKKSKKKLIIIIALIAALIAGGASAYFLTQSDTTSEQSQSSEAKTKEVTAESLTSLFNYASIKDVVEFDGYTWVALGSGVLRYNDNTIESYDQTDGLDGPAARGFVVFGDQLFVGTQNGVSRYVSDQNTFKPYFTDVTEDAFSGGIGNVYLFNNTVGNVLSVSSFKGFYEYSSASDSFVSANGPQNTRNIYFNDTEGVAITWIGGSTSVLYSYTSGNGWSEPKGLTDYAGQQVYVRMVDDRFVVFGRSSGYQSCGSVGLAQATLFNEYKQGQFTPVLALNEQFKLVDVSLGYDLANYDVKSFPCEGTDEKAYNFVIESGEIQVQEVANPIEPSDPEAEQPYVDVIEALKQKLGREPIFRVVGVEADGSLITMYSDGIVGPNGRGSSSAGAASSTLGFDLAFSNLATVDEGRFGNASVFGEADWIDTYTVTTAVLCNGTLSYVMFVDISDYDSLIYAAKLYDVTGGSLVEVADFKDTLTSSDAPRNVYCSDESLQWVDNTDLLTFDRQSKEVSRDTVFNTNRFGVALVGDKMWLSANAYASVPLGYRDMKTGEFTDVSVAVDYGTANDPKSNSLIGINDSYIWMVLDANPNGTVVAFNLDGSKAYEYSLASTDDYIYPNGGALIGNNKMVLTLQGSWSTYEGFMIFDAGTKTTQELKPEIPVRGDLGSLVYNPIDATVWVNAGDALFSFKVEQ